MRTLALAFLVVGLSISVADEPFTQKPEVAPSVVRGETPEEQPKVEQAAANWDDLFSGGPKPLWIWGADPNEKYHLRAQFDAKDVTAAKVKFTADNHVKLVLNGKEVGSCDEWQDGAEADVTKLLKAEGNELIAEVWNDGGPSGFALKLVMKTRDDRTGAKYVVSDQTWTTAKDGDRRSVAVKKVGTYGNQPWGNVFQTAMPQPGSKIPANTFVTLPGFQVEKLFSVPKAQLGSWVCITADDKGRLIASDQEGKGLVRITPGTVGTDEATKVERLDLKLPLPPGEKDTPESQRKRTLTAAQGILWHKGTLYVVCNGGPGSGLYRVTSSKNDDTLDTVEKLKAINGGGEHGPHAIRLGPDGKSLYVVAGNYTKVPQGATSRVPPKQGEDHLLPRMWDANGHATGLLAPGGWVAKTDLDGKRWEVFSSGYRNAYDFAFNADGEMFVYDSDMEWDMGMPWYRPTRVSHTVSGGDYGWRSGSGVWPAYYPDSLPAMIDIGPGSPVGVEFGYGAKFPAKYQKALFICDWTFGTMYAIHIEPNGATYKATKEEFLSRTPLPLTDACINPADGAMYFTIGGRGAQSELFRVTYVGKDVTGQVEYATHGSVREIRKSMELFQLRAPLTEKQIWFLIDCLRTMDRFGNYAARVALEHQDVKLWQDKVLRSDSVVTVVQGVIALAHQGDKSLQPKVLAALDKIDVTKGNEPFRLDLLRAYQLVFTRMGEPDKDTATKLVAKFDPLFPAQSDNINRELAQLLVYLKSPTIVEKLCAELKKPSKPLSQAELNELILRNPNYGGPIAKLIQNSADQQKLAYLFILRNATVGWNMDRRRVYYGFLNEALNKSGGASYRGFLKNIEQEAFANATEADRGGIEGALLRPSFVPATLPKAIGPGRQWTTADVVALEEKLKRGRNFKNGERAFAAARCVVCHRVGGEGGATGPDLSQVAGRFGIKELAEALVEPSKVVSDQYKASVVRTADEKTIVGKIVNDTGEKYIIVLDPEDSTKLVEVKKSDVTDLKPSNVSLMPEKLLNSLNEGEVLDMLAYMLSRGDQNHPMFRK